VGKKDRKGDDVTRFWYTLKNLDPFPIEKVIKHNNGQRKIQGG
jgi:hypothetical protein